MKIEIEILVEAKRLQEALYQFIDDEVGDFVKINISKKEVDK